MAETVAILIPRENVNDESATVVSWLVADGTHVERGQRVVQIETSKAVMELEAPAAGILRQTAAAGQDVPIGAPIGRVEGDGWRVEGKDPPPATLHPPLELPPSVRGMVAEQSIDLSEVRGTGRGGRITKADVLSHMDNNTGATTRSLTRLGSPTRLSARAKELARQLGLDEGSFQGRGLVRCRDIQSPAEEKLPEPVPAPGPRNASDSTRPVAAAGVPARIEPLSRAKRTEANYLRSGLDSTLPSVVTIPCPTRGFRAAAKGNATAIILFEAARLLRKYPEFNAFHSDGSGHYYQECNIGFAVDPGRSLRVPVVKSADRKGLAEIADEMRDLAVACLDKTLRVESLAGGTFTLTDLSGEGVTVFHPLINRGQSAILGVCAEVFTPGSAWGSFNLVLAFDHQLGEGRTAANFLGELRERIGHHESSLIRGKDTTSVEEPRCSRCLRSHSELAALSSLLLRAVKGDGSVRLVCSLCVNGWNG